ncbi:MAG: isoprenylcysteine carboxylmethyltransferase family protein [Aestuariivirga sp.]
MVSVLFIVAVTALAIVVSDTLMCRVYQRDSTGLDFQYDDPSIGRSITKCLGLFGTVGIIGLLYWLFPEYHEDYYKPFFDILNYVVPAWLLLAFPYIYLTDRHMRKPHDTYWQIGRAILGDWRALHGEELSQFALGWLVKGFFIPLMTKFMWDDVRFISTLDLSTLNSFPHWFDFLLSNLYFTDVGLALVGYIVTLRLTDTHLRSTEPTMVGWVVALECYPPFWTAIFSVDYLSYDRGLTWGTWLWNYPALYSVWGMAILILTGIYLWATIAFGARFSNLTYRGLITTGPYRYCKHPAYLTKNLSWWMISVPFLAVDSWQEAARHSILLLCVNVVYYLRAKTEERHLRRYPEYVQYMNWIGQSGLIGRINRFRLELLRGN